jgi:hypothetical protein
MQRLIQSPCGADHLSALEFDAAIVAARFDNLAMKTCRAEGAAYYLMTELKSVSCGRGLGLGS